MNHPVQNIALFGLTGAGKTEVAKHLVSKYGYARVGTGDICRKICRLAFDSESKTLLNQVTDAFIQIKDDVWLSAALRSAPKNCPLVFDSMRFWRDYKYLTTHGFVACRVDGSTESRATWLKLRGQEFKIGVDDQHPAEIELASADATYILENTRTLDFLHAAVDDVIVNLANERR